MLTVIQRVSIAKVAVKGKIVGEIAKGLMILCGFETTDQELTLHKMLDKVINYRVFDDSNGKMNLSLKDINGSLLLVPQFTLMADTRKGLRPSFSKAGSPELGQALFTRLLGLAQEKHPHVASGQFGSEMQVFLCNEGPVTFLLNF